MENNIIIPQTIDPEEFLYRGVVESQWDAGKNRPTSAAFKCSSGLSVNRDVQQLDLNSCVNVLLETKPFKAICRLKERAVREVNAITKYLPVPGNEYHCEIHDSEQKVTLSGSKPSKLRDRAEVVYLD